MKEKDPQTEEASKEVPAVELDSSPAKIFPRSKVQLLVMTALFTALVFVVTLMASVPSWTGQGIINLGDSAIASSAVLMPHPLMAVVGGVGSALANLANPAATVYAPATLIIKGLMGLVLFFFARKGKFLWFALGVVLAELIMVTGYFLYEFIFLIGAGAFASLLPNAVQAGTNLVLALILFAPLMALRKALWDRPATEPALPGKED